MVLESVWKSFLEHEAVGMHLHSAVKSNVSKKCGNWPSRRYAPGDLYLKNQDGDALNAKWN